MSNDDNLISLLLKDEGEASLSKSPLRFNPNLVSLSWLKAAIAEHLSGSRSARGMLLQVERGEGVTDLKSVKELKDGESVIVRKRSLESVALAADDKRFHDMSFRVPLACFFVDDLDYLNEEDFLELFESNPQLRVKFKIFFREVLAKVSGVSSANGIGVGVEEEEGELDPIDNQLSDTFASHNLTSILFQKSVSGSRTLVDVQKEVSGIEDSIHALLLSGNNLMDDDVPHIVALVNKLSKCKILDLSFNQITSKSQERLAELGKHTSLEYVVVFGNPIATAEFLNSLASSMSALISKVIFMPQGWLDGNPTLNSLHDTALHQAAFTTHYKFYTQTPVDVLIRVLRSETLAQQRPDIKRSLVVARMIENLPAVISTKGQRLAAISRAVKDRLVKEDGSGGNAVLRLCNFTESRDEEKLQDEKGNEPQIVLQTVQDLSKELGTKRVKRSIVGERLMRRNPVLFGSFAQRKKAIEEAIWSGLILAGGALGTAFLELK